MRIKLIAALLFICAFGFAQSKGTITGTLTDKDLNNEPLPFANVSIKGTNTGVTSDDKGKYTISVDAGTYTIQFSFLGYETIEEKIEIKAGETLTINKALGSGSYQLQDVVIQKTVSREKETALLLEQKNAVEMKQAIGAQELSRKGVSDAAGAVVKTTGVAKQEGVNNVFVRGLGDRYNSTTLNGLPLPSEDPVYKNISLEFFNSNIIKNININKTFNPELYGDVAGANIDISSKELDKKSYFSAAVGTEYNDNAISASKFLVADGAYSYFGFLQNGKNVPISNLQTYGFDTNFKPEEKSTPINTSFNILGGRKFDLGGSRSFSLFGVVMSDSKFQYKEGVVRQITSTGARRQDMNLQKSEYKATQALLANAKYKFGSGSIAWNSVFIHDNNQSVGDYRGFLIGVDGDDIDYSRDKSFVRRQQMNDNNLFVNQLLADYKFSEKISANVGVAYNTMRGSEPDRKTNTYGYDYAGTNGQIVGLFPGLNNRFFSTMEENDLTAKAELDFTFNPTAELKKVLTFGANYRTTDRTFDYLQINYSFAHITPIDIDNPEGVFNQQMLSLGRANGGFDLVTLRGTGINAFKPYFYLADRDVVAGYAQLVYPFSEKLIAQVGVRFENFKQRIDWDTYLSSSVNDLTVDPSIIEKTYVLPSISLKYSINEKNALRFAASETYTMPQFKEAAPFLYEDVNFSEFGNPDLVPSTDYNFDVKYDWYFSKKEIISFGTFFKYIQDPISRVRVSSASNDLSYINTTSAFATGVEVEIRKSLFNVEGETRNKDLSFGLNTSYLYTEQKQDDVTTDNLTPSFTHDKGRMQGASPLLINADLSYNTSNGHTALTSTVVFNYAHDKVYSLGTVGLENIVEKSVPTLDFINRFELKKYKLGLNLGVKNILNPKFRLTQETTDLSGQKNETEVSSYRKGLVVSFGLNWTL